MILKRRPLNTAEVFLLRKPYGLELWCTGNRYSDNKLLILCRLYDISRSLRIIDCG